MPVAGPDKFASDRRADELFEDIMDLLKDKYHLCPPTMVLHRPYDQKLKDEWAAGTAKLREALKELTWVDACDAF